MKDIKIKSDIKIKIFQRKGREVFAKVAEF